MAIAKQCSHAFQLARYQLYKTGKDVLSTDS